MPAAEKEEEKSLKRMEAAQAEFDKIDGRLQRLKAELIKVEAAREAAEAELSAASAAHEGALVAADERKRREKRWHPPCDAPSRSRALNEPDESPLARCWELCESLPLPRPTDWLAKGQVGEKDRPGQTVAQYCRPGRAVPSPALHVIYLVPLGRATGAPPLRTLSDFLRAMYGLDVRPLPADAMPSPGEVGGLGRVGGSGMSYGPMLSSSDACDLLVRFKPKDAFMLLAYTMEDLQAPRSGGGSGGGGDGGGSGSDGRDDAEDALNELSLNVEGAEASGAAAEKKGAGETGAAQYVFGESQPLRGVGVVSFARFGDGCTLVDLPDAVAFAYVSRSVGTHSRFLRRCVNAIGHECGRLLGMARCVYGRCLLNGAIHLAEIDARPLLPCPCDLKKLASTLDDAARTGLHSVPTLPMVSRLAARERHMQLFLCNHGFEEEGARTEQRLAIFAAAEGTRQAEARQQSYENETELEREMELARLAVRREAEMARELARLDGDASGGGSSAGSGLAASRQGRAGGAYVAHGGAIGDRGRPSLSSAADGGASAAPPPRRGAGSTSLFDRGAPPPAGGAASSARAGAPLDLNVQAAVTFAPVGPRGGARSERGTAGTGTVAGAGGGGDVRRGPSPPQMRRGAASPRGERPAPPDRGLGSQPAVRGGSASPRGGGGSAARSASPARGRR